MALLRSRPVLTIFFVIVALLSSLVQSSDVPRNSPRNNHDQPHGLRPYEYGFDVHKLVRRQLNKRQRSSTPLIVKGAGRGEVRLRQEIRVMEQDQDLWTLYILALSMMQFTDQSVETSWYQITGIHGIPFQTWGGVNPTPGNEDTGYCTHSSVLFPTWHRPYLALYEQIMYGLVAEIANWWPEGPERRRFQAAADRFRLPYWDWATPALPGQSVFPLSVGGNAYISVSGPNGMQSISNPLYNYNFRPLNATAMLRAPWNVWPTTLRSPTTADQRAQSNNSLVALNMDRSSTSLGQRLYMLFSNYGDYTAFSNNVISSVNSSYDSLESLHDTVHNMAGGGGVGLLGGHMAYIPYSAFDPIFFLHHTMVDRIFAIWQELYPNSWITPRAALLPSYTTSSGQIQDSRTALTPFFASTNGTFWTSDMVRDHRIFGYTYPELNSSAGTKPKPKRQDNVAEIRKAINRLYGSSSPAYLFIKAAMAKRANNGDLNNRQSLALTPDHDNATDTQERENHSRSAIKSLSGVVFVENRYHEWIANINVNKQALNGPFSIHLFLGEVPPAGPQSWSTAPSHIGSMGVFASGDGSTGVTIPMKTHQKHAVDISGTIPLTKTLVDKVVRGELKSLNPADVEEHLRMNLKKRVLRLTDGKVFEAPECDRVPGLRVHIIGTVVRAPATDEELPSWGEEDSRFDMY